MLDEADQKRTGFLMVSASDRNNPMLVSSCSCMVRSDLSKALGRDEWQDFDSILLVVPISISEDFGHLLKAH